MVQLDDVDIDVHILDKIESKHGVSFKEVEEVCYGRHHDRRGPGQVYRLFGQTEAGRYLLVVVASRGQGVWKVVTARDMVASEPGLYLRHRGSGR